MNRWWTCAAVALVAAWCDVTWAHGGNPNPAQPPADPGLPLGPGWKTPDLSQGTPMDSGTQDPAAPVTRWETWWAANKEGYLRLAERMRATAGNQTPGRPVSARERDAAERRDAAQRRRLADVFIEALGDSDFEVRTAAAIALGKSGDARGSEPLRRVARKDPVREVGDSAVLGLGLLGQAADVPFLMELLLGERNDASQRAFAAFSLGLIGGEDASAVLLQALPAAGSRGSLPRPEIHASVLVGLGLSGCEAGLPTLRAAADDARLDANVRAFAVLALGRQGDRESLARVTALVAPRADVALRRAGALALGRIAAPTDLEAVRALLTAARDENDPLARHFAAVALGGLRGPGVLEVLLTTFRAAREADRPFLALALALQGDRSIVTELVEALRDERDASRASALCVALGLLGDETAAPALEEQLASPRHPWLQGYAALALGLLGHQPSVQALRNGLESTRDGRLRINLAIALGLLHDPRARTFLLETLRTGERFYERGSAALALGALRLTTAIPDLEAVYRDRAAKDILRAYAVVALGQIADPSPVPKLARFSIDGDYSGAISVKPLNEVLSIY